MSLEPDIVTIPGQQYALISVVSPTSAQKNDTCAVKIKGVFATQEEAANWAKKLQKLDSTFDIYLVELYKWLPIPPNNDHIENQVYQDEILNELIQGKEKEQLKAKEFFEQRKRENIKTKIQENVGTSQNWADIDEEERKPKD